jgi:hypothetical protein
VKFTFRLREARHSAAPPRRHQDQRFCRARAGILKQLDAVILRVKDRSVCTRGGPCSPVRVCRVPQPDWGRLPEFRRRRQPR